MNIGMEVVIKRNENEFDVVYVSSYDDMIALFDGDEARYTIPLDLLHLAIEKISAWESAG